jgi:hypothetical protein
VRPIQPWRSASCDLAGSCTINQWRSAWQGSSGTTAQLGGQDKSREVRPGRSAEESWNIRTLAFKIGALVTISVRSPWRPAARTRPSSPRLIGPSPPLQPIPAELSAPPRHCHRRRSARHRRARLHPHTVRSRTQDSPSANPAAKACAKTPIRLRQNPFRRQISGLKKECEICELQ